MPDPTITIDAAAAAAKLRMVVRVGGLRRFTLRAIAGHALLRLAIHVLPYRCDVELQGELEVALEPPKEAPASRPLTHLVQHCGDGRKVREAMDQQRRDPPPDFEPTTGFPRIHR